MSRERRDWRLKVYDRYIAWIRHTYPCSVLRADGKPANLFVGWTTLRWQHQQKLDVRAAWRFHQRYGIKSMSSRGNQSIEEESLAINHESN